MHDSHAVQTSALAQFEAARQVSALRSVCMSEDGGCAVVRCMSLCAATKLLPPTWLADAFVERCARVKNATVGTWDEAFGRPWPRGARLAQIRQDEKLKALVYDAVFEQISKPPYPAINKQLFKTIGALPGISKSGATVERLYYKALQDGRKNPKNLFKREKTNPQLTEDEPRIDRLLHRQPTP